MSAVAVLAAVEAVDGLFEAVILRAEPSGAVVVRRPGDPRELVTRPAVLGYAPSPGDHVLVASGRRDGPRWIVGVLGVPSALTITHDPVTGAATLAVAGDLVLRAPAGEVRIEARALRQAADELEIEARIVRTVAERVEVSAARVETWAGLVRERAREVYRDVEGVMSTRAGRLRTLVRGTAQLLAKRASIRATEDAAIDGKRVLLG